MREHSLLLHSKFLTSLPDYTPPNDSLNFLHHNSHSLLPKHGMYSALPHLQRYEVLSFSESWLNSNISANMIEFPNFKVFRGDRADGRAGGGAVLYTMTSLQAVLLPNYAKHLTCDSVWVKITPAGRTPLIVASIYLPPSNDKPLFLEQLSNILQDPKIVGCDIVICGDININWNSKSSHKLSLNSIAQQFQLNQLISGFTYVDPRTAHESLLDLCFSSVSLPVISAKTLTTDISDHYAITFSFQLHIKKNPRILRCCRSFLSGLSTLPKDAVYNTELVKNISSEADPSKQAELLENWVYNLTEKHAPMETIRVRLNSNKWIDKGLKAKIAQKTGSFKKQYKLILIFVQQNGMNIKFLETKYSP